MSVSGDPQIRVGTVLYGYCRGYLQKAYLDTARVEAVGADWLVARDPEGRVYFAELETDQDWQALLEDSEQERLKRLAEEA